MSELIFGIIWTLFSSFFFVIMLFSSRNANIGEIIIPILIVSVFIIIGIVLITKGAKKIIKDRKTSKYGIPCYCIVRNILNTGTYVNGHPEFKVIVDVVNPNTNQIEELEEIIGFNSNKYPINSYLACKYYEGDINIDRIASDNEVSDSYKRLLVQSQNTVNNSYPQPGNMGYGTGFNPGYTDISFSSDREYVTIDGVTYKKVN